MYFKDHFDYGAVLNGESLFQKTEDEVREMLKGDTENYALVILERDGEGGQAKEVLSGADVGLELVIGDDLKRELAAQSGLNWLKAFLQPHEIKVSSALEIDETKWDAAMDQLQCFSKEFVKAPKDAVLTDYQEGIGYEIQPEQPGNTADRKIIEPALKEAMLGLAESLDLETLDCYAKPKITSEDPKLLAKKEALEKYTNVTIKYTFDENEEIVNGDLISQWITVDSSDKVTLNTEKVADYVATLRKRYDSIFRPRTFKTSYGGTVELEDGDYGWWMNYRQEEKELIAMIEAGESGERTPVYYQTANSYGENDYGDDYVEVNLTAQHLLVYQDGKVVYETDFVSGRDTENRRTPEGVYGITYKERYAKLTGEDYASPVYYWMPFNGNVGLHDATWRSYFGSDYYKGGGSHGCINLPCEAAKTIFGLVSQGTAVIVYSQEGTESDSVTTQDSSQIAQVCIDAIDALDAYGTTQEQRKKSVEWCRLFYNEIGDSARSQVTNLDKLREAEEDLR